MSIPKPDNRRDNAAKNAQIAENTAENLRESEQYLAAHGDELSQVEKNDLTEKNDRREESIQSHKAEAAEESKESSFNI